MNQILQIKKIVAVFLKADEDLINPDTVIDRSAIKGSIMIHRMYAAISRELGSEIKDYGKIKTFGDLLERCGVETGEGKPSAALAIVQEEVSQKRKDNLAVRVKESFSIGIDMEEVNKMPQVADFRSEIFYTHNFSPQEISYCLLQPDPLQSFAGKFAAKEAIVKADNSYRGIPFCQIEINNDMNGNPCFMNFVLSISHTDQLAIAVAVKVPVKAL